MKNSDPYNLPGRWYQFFIESTGVGAILTDGDIDGAELVNDSMLYLPAGYMIVDTKYMIHTAGTATGSLIPTLTVTSKDNKQGVDLMAPQAYDYQYVYLFCVKE